MDSALGLVGEAIPSLPRDVQSWVTEAQWCVGSGRHSQLGLLHPTFAAVRGSAKAPVSAGHTQKHCIWIVMRGVLSFHYINRSPFPAYTLNMCHSACLCLSFPTCDILCCVGPTSIPRAMLSLNRVKYSKTMAWSLSNSVKESVGALHREQKCIFYDATR